MGAGMTTIYYETGIPARLVPVAFVGWAKTPIHDVTGRFNAVVRLKRATHGYPCGTVLHVPVWSVVHKAGRRDYKQLVRPAALPPVDPLKLIDSRV